MGRGDRLSNVRVDHGDHLQDSWSGDPAERTSGAIDSVR